MTKNLSLENFFRSRLKLRHLQLVLAIDEQRNLHRAADKMNIAQPAASKLLSEIESIVEVPLFFRHSRGLVPTIHGDIFIRNSTIILKMLNQTAEELRSVAQGASGTVSIGTITGAMIEFLVEVIENTRQKYPKITVSIEHNTSDVLLKKLLNGSIDFLLGRIGYGIDSGKLSYQKLYGEKCVFLCREGHPLAKKTFVNEEDLLNWPWVLQPRGSMLRHEVEQLFLKANLPMPESIVATTSAMMSLILVLRSDAVTILESNTANIMIGTGKWQKIHYREELHLDYYGLIKSKERQISPAAETICREIIRLSDEKTEPGQEAQTIAAPVASAELRLSEV